MTDREREYLARWRKKNPDYWKRWSKANLEYKRNWMRAYRAQGATPCKSRIILGVRVRVNAKVEE